MHILHCTTNREKFQHVIHSLETFAFRQEYYTFVNSLLTFEKVPIFRHFEAIWSKKEDREQKPSPSFS